MKDGNEKRKWAQEEDAVLKNIILVKEQRFRIKYPEGHHKHVDYELAILVFLYTKKFIYTACKTNQRHLRVLQAVLIQMD